MSVIEKKIGLFAVQQERVLEHALELLEAGFDKIPEGLGAVDVRSNGHEFVLAVGEGHAEAFMQHTKPNCLRTSGKNWSVMGWLIRPANPRR